MRLFQVVLYPFMAGISGKPKIVCSSQEKQTLLLECFGEVTADRHKKNPANSVIVRVYRVSRK